MDEAFDKMEKDWIEECSKIYEELERREKELPKELEIETEELPEK
jgi:hypothetical protein